MPEGSSTSSLYGEFIRDLKSKDLKILPDEQVRDRIITIRSVTSTEEEKNAARNQIIESSLRMIPFAIDKLPNQGILPQELVGEGFDIINRCIDRFNPDFISPITEEPAKFSSYVFESLDKGLRSPRSVVRVGEVVKIPVYAETFVIAMRKARELFMQEESREPNQNEWYTRTLRFIDENRSPSAPIPSPENFGEIKRARFTGVSRIGKVAYRGNVHTDTLSPAVGPVEETLADESDTAEEAIKAVLADDMERVMEKLAPRQRKVLELRFGIGLDEKGEQRQPMTLEEIGRIFHVSKERIRLIEASALKRLRRPDTGGVLREYIEPADERSEQSVIEARYREDVDLIARQVLSKLTPQNVNDFLEDLKKGSPKDGRLNSEVLLRIGLIATVAEEKYFRFKPPRIMVRDVVDKLNLYLSSSRHDNNKSRWNPVKEIKLEE